MFNSGGLLELCSVIANNTYGCVLCVCVVCVCVCVCVCAHGSGEVRCCMVKVRESVCDCVFLYCSYGEPQAKEGDVVCYGQPVALVTLPDEGGQVRPNMRP